jgi:hypothetical protein
MLRFEVFCADELGAIGSDTHERVIIDMPRFLRRVSDRAIQAGVGRRIPPEKSIFETRRSAYQQYSSASKRLLATSRAVRR